jgi:hypothetical protein
MDNAPITPHATRGYPVDHALVRANRAQRGSRRRSARLRALAKRLGRAAQRQRLRASMVVSAERARDSRRCPVAVGQAAGFGATSTSPLRCRLPHCALVPTRALIVDSMITRYISWR